MPRIGDVYSPPYDPVVSGTPIESVEYNGTVADITLDLNTPRPVVAGGTGANSAEEALFNLGGEKAAQLVTNYDSHMWLPGSFRSATTATGAPVDGHDFAGVCYLNEAFAYPPANQEVVVEARDQDDTTVPGRLYVREKKAGTWSAWIEQVGGTTDLTATYDARYVNVTGDTMTGALTVNAAITGASVTAGAVTTGTPTTGTYFFSTSGTRYLTYDGTHFGLIGGNLTLPADPSAAMQAATKQYVDANSITQAAADTRYVNVTGDTMTDTLYVGNGRIVSRNTLGAGGAVACFDGTNSHGIWTAGTAALKLGQMTGTGDPAAVWASLGNSDLTITGSNGVFVSGYQSSSQYATYLIRADPNWGNVMALMAYHIPGTVVGFRMDMNGVQFDFRNDSQAYKAGGGSWGAISDARIKTVLSDYTSGLEAISALRPVRYVYKGNDTQGPPSHQPAGALTTDPEPEYAPTVPYRNSPNYGVASAQKEFIGLLAQEAEASMPEMVTQGPGTIDGVDVTDLRALDTTPLIFALINAVKELKAEVDALKAAP